jgi:hypothetical protein
MLDNLNIYPPEQYLDFISREEPEEIDKLYTLKNLPSILGSDMFKESIRDKFYGLANQPEIPESKSLAPDVEKVILAVCEFYGISRKKMLAYQEEEMRICPEMWLFTLFDNCAV